MSVEFAVATCHLAWTTYGAWLPGDARGWIRKYDDVPKPPDELREHRAREAMQEPEVELSAAQRALVEKTITDHCRIRNWELHALNVRSNHAHVVVTAECDAAMAMGQFKAWCSRKLSDAAGLDSPIGMNAGRRRWFTEGGHATHIENERYLRHAIRYVLDHQ